MSNLVLDVGLAAKLKVAFARNGWTEELIDKACEGDKLGQFRQVMLGHASVQVNEHMVDCDADPFVPDGWKVEEHQKSGSFQWDASKVEFYLDKGQQNGKYFEGNKLRKQLAGKSVLNANVLDYLLAHPRLIPEDWKKDERGNMRYIFFWGTIFRNSDGVLYVRYLYWGGGRWDWGAHWLGRDWRGSYPAAVRAS